jgi:mono/diheme cytochrome c family protein
VSARRLVPLCLAALALAGCNLSMDKQPRYSTQVPGPLFPDGASARMPVPGTVAQGQAAEEAIATNPPPATPALLARGRERFDIFCKPCHGPSGEGNGTIVARGFPHPPSFHEARLMQAPASHFYDVIGNGYGVMFPYGARVRPADRWAVIAYIRALQLSGAGTASPAQAGRAMQ